MSRFVRYCDAVMEATWLTALACVPLLSVHWGQSLQDTKCYLLRSLAALLLTAWAVRFVLHSRIRSEARRTGASPLLDSATPKANVSKAAPLEAKPAFRQRLSRNWLELWRWVIETPLAAPVILVATTTLISTVLSVSPWTSFWGTSVRRSGSYTDLSSLVFFAAIAGQIRSKQQVRRLMTVLILTSLPICLYGIEEKFSVGPIASRSDGVFRIGSTLGNPVFLAAYLIMVFPLTLVQSLEAAAAIRSADCRNTASLANAILFAGVALLQVWTILLTISRGPLLGLAAGSLILAMLLAIYWRQRWIPSALVGSATLLLALVVWASRSTGPFQKWTDRPDVQRFLAPLRSKTHPNERTAIWNVAAKAARFSTVMELGNESKDSFASLRCLVGYGPETVGFVSRAFAATEYNLALSGHPAADRFHNDFWDTLITTGTLGLASHLALLLTAVYFGCRGLNLIRSRREKVVYWALVFGGGLVGVFGLAHWQGVGFVGVGLSFGAIFGLVVCLARASLRSGRSAIGCEFLSLSALLAGIVAHTIETNFSFGMETTSLYFWVYLALLIVIGNRRATGEPVVAVDGANRSPNPKATSPTAKPLRSPRQPPFRRTVWQTRWIGPTEGLGGILIGLVLANLGVMLIQRVDAGDAIKTIADALTRLPGTTAIHSWSLAFSALAPCLIMALSIANESGRSGSSTSWWRSFARTLGIGSTVGFGYWLALAQHRAHLPPPSRVSLAILSDFLRGYSFDVDLYYGFVLGAILLFAVFLMEAEPPGGAQRRSSGILNQFLAGLLAVAGLAIAHETNLKWAKVEAMDYWVDYFTIRRQWPIAAALGEAAVQSTPASDHPYFVLGKIYLDWASATRTTEERQALFQKADRVLEKGGQLRPINHTILVRRAFLYLKRAESESELDRKIEFGEKAIEYYRKAAVLDPGNDTIWYSMALVAANILRAPDQAIPWLARSIALYPSSHLSFGLLGSAYFSKGTASTNSNNRDHFLKSAVTNFQTAAVLAPDPASRYRYAASLGDAYARLSDLTSAIAAYEQALGMSPPEDRWRIEEALARLHAQLGAASRANAHWQRAVELAPAANRNSVIQLKNESFWPK